MTWVCYLNDFTEIRYVKLLFHIFLSIFPNKSYNFIRRTYAENSSKVQGHPVCLIAFIVSYSTVLIEPRRASTGETSTRHERRVKCSTENVQCGGISFIFRSSRDARRRFSRSLSLSLSSLSCTPIRSLVRFFPPSCRPSHGISIGKQLIIVPLIPSSAVAVQGEWMVDSP